MYCYISHLWSEDTETCLRFLSFKYVTQWNVLYPLLYHQDSAVPCPNSEMFSKCLCWTDKIPISHTFLLYPIWHTNHQWLTPQPATFVVQAVCGAGVDTQEWLCLWACALCVWWDKDRQTSYLQQKPWAFRHEFQRHQGGDAGQSTHQHKDPPAVEVVLGSHTEPPAWKQQEPTSENTDQELWVFLCSELCSSIWHDRLKVCYS